MRRLSAIVLLIGLSFGSGCQKETATPPAHRHPPGPTLTQAPPPPAPPVSDVLLRWHFVGAEQLAGNTNAAKVREVWALPASADLRAQAFKRLADVLPGQWSLSTNATNTAALIRPLLDDLVRAESVFELGSAAGGSPDWSLAIDLDDQRAALWQTNVGSLTGAGFWRSGRWVVFASAAAAPPAARLLAEIKKTGRPVPATTNHWLEVQADLPRLAKKLSWPAQVEWPHALLSINGKDGYLRSNLRMRFIKPLSLSLEAWQIPTNIIHDPVISFTAVRGVAAWLREQPLFRQLEIQPAPNQAFFWAQTPVPTQTFFALPAPGAAGQMERLAPALMKLWNTNLLARQRGEFILGSNRTEIIWARVPVPLAGPFLRPAPDAQGSFLMGGLFPPVPAPNPLPQELLQQISGRTNLVYYDWEVTQPRLLQWHQMFQLTTMLFNRMPDLGLGAGQQWFLAVAPLLGNTISEVTAASPQELVLTRKSHLGFTGIELVLLGRWLEDAPLPWQEQKSLAPSAPGVVKPPPAP